MSELICLGMFANHSFYPWCWRSNLGLYYRQCSLYGCPHEETARDLEPAGVTLLTSDRGCYIHNWLNWRFLGDSEGLYIPPWKYQRRCFDCQAEEFAENLVKKTS